MNARIPSSAAMAAGLLLLAAAPAWTQVVYNNASTVGESYARGMSDMVRAAGDYNLQTSAAAGQYQDAYSKYLDNRVKATQNYFEMRKMNSDYRAAEKDRYYQRCSEAMARHSQAGKPARLSATEVDTVSGQIAWPALLMNDEFAADRKQLEELFAKRAAQGVLTTPEKTELRKACLDLKNGLVKYRAKASPTDYKATDAFIHSLAYEGQSPVG